MITPSETASLFTSWIKYLLSYFILTTTATTTAKKTKTIKSRRSRHEWGLVSRPFVSPTYHSKTTPLTFNENSLKQSLLQSNPNIMTPNVGKSIYYFVQDYSILIFLWYTRESWVFSGTYGLGWLVWVLVTGFFMWALFVVGHDCGHETFSKSNFINLLFGHLSHTPLLVPFYGWKLSHYYHHLYHNDIDRDTVWYPLNKTLYNLCPKHFQILRYSHVLLFLYPFYLLDDGPMSSGNHFNPTSRLFKTKEEKFYGWISALSVLSFVIFSVSYLGIGSFLIYYVPSYLVFIFWLDLVTYLHHTHPEGKYYRKPSWSFFKGALTTIDRSYGWIIDILHHNINLHVAHHIFFNKIPHYNLKEATSIIKPLLGEYYHYDKNNFWSSYIQARQECQFVADDGTVLTYESKEKK